MNIFPFLNYFNLQKLGEQKAEEKKEERIERRVQKDQKEAMKVKKRKKKKNGIIGRDRQTSTKKWGEGRGKEE